jgi:hypothetical protein
MRPKRFPYVAFAGAVAFVSLLLYVTNYMRLDGAQAPPDQAFRPETTGDRR